MKLLYCHCSLHNPGGMERVLLNKVVWLKAHTDWEIVVVTTDQKQRPTFYPFPKEVRMIDLGINYTDDNAKSPLEKIAGYLRKDGSTGKRLRLCCKRKRRILWCRSILRSLRL